ncbi:SDR family NAD(P)-dependent oxidoreductase [Pantoea sp.]|uniref:SDR family NAD(P)-dependent oxidoreductase n=1 Tax=Pantoea sp. TaxID=69393 RepID=UPI0028962C6E|nr:SDR family NAD(P)-dependent oxidoreductase [Pantoea sp.]
MSNNKLALITGASNGIGFEIAKQFAKNGYDILAVARKAAWIRVRCRRLIPIFSLLILPIVISASPLR